MTNIVTPNANINVVQVTSPGPLGPIGPQGVQGNNGTVEANSGFVATPFLRVTGSMAVTGSSSFFGDVSITGSLTVSGSNTFVNIGPARFTGSVNVSGSIFATTFSGSGAGLSSIPASSITGLNLTRIGIGNVSASVDTGGNSFTVNNGGSNLFTVSSAGLGTFLNGLTINGSAGIFNQGLNVNNAVANLNAGLVVQGSATLNGAVILTSATVSTSRITDSNISASVSSTGKAFSVNNGATVLSSVDQQGAISGSGLNISGSNTLINSPNIALVGNATLNGQAITTAGDLTLNQIKTGAVTASVSTGANSFLLESAGTNLFSISNIGILSGSGANLFNIPATGITGLNLSRVATGSISASVNIGATSFELVSGSTTLLTINNTGVATISSSINIGRPTDGGYSTGFFDTFTNTTKVSDAIDEISAAFLDLAPAKPGVLTGTSLTVSAPSFFSGYLSAGLNSSDWYVDASAHNIVSNLSNTTTITLNTPDTSTRFRAGKNSDRVANTLIGGVSSSKALGNATLAVSSTRDLISGNGSTGTIQITDIAQYLIFWAKANARINDTLTITGSYKYAISSDNGAGSTNSTQLWYVGGLTDYPNQTVTATTPTTSSTTFNFLSGVPYLKTATFTLGITGSNLFNPVYNLNQISFASSFFSALTTGSNAPNFNDTLLLTTTRTLTSNINSGQNFPTFTVTATKPGKTNASSGTITLTGQKVNSYSSAQSTNTVEFFLDEAKRYGDFQTSSWTSTTTLADGNLQVQNGRLIAGVAGDYPTFVATTQDYFRALTVTPNTSPGTFSFLVSGFSSISPWGSGGELEIAFAKATDVNGPETATILWDFGRALGNVSGNIVGIVTGTLGLSGTFSLGTFNSGNGSLILYIKYNNVTTAKIISQFTVSM